MGAYDGESGAGAGRAAVVVGAGIGGLAAARALQLSGWSVHVLEQAQRLDPLGAGISLWPNAVLALDALHVTLPGSRDGSWLPSDGGGPATGGIRTSQGRWLSRSDTSTFLTRYGASMIALHRGDLQQALLGSLPADTVLTGAHVDQLDQQPDHVEVRHSQGAARADLVVLADGLASRTRSLVTGPLPRARYAGYTAWRAVTDHAALPESAGATESWGRGERFGIVPLVDGRTYWFATANSTEGEHVPGGEHAALLRRFAGWHQPIEQVLQATEPDAVLRHDVYDLRPDPPRYNSDRLVLLGDAAHAMTPNLGQGACQALEDAVTLGALTRGGTPLGQALTTYDALRRPRAQLIARRSRQIGRLGQLSGHAAATARDVLLRAAPPQLADRELHATLSWQPPTV